MAKMVLPSDIARTRWGEIVDAAMAGDVVEITRHKRPAVIMIGAKLYERLLRRIEDAEDLADSYEILLDHANGKDDSEIFTAEELKQRIADNEPIPA